MIVRSYRHDAGASAACSRKMICSSESLFRFIGPSFDKAGL